MTARLYATIAKSSQIPQSEFGGIQCSVVWSFVAHGDLEEHRTPINFQGSVRTHSLV